MGCCRCEARMLIFGTQYLQELCSPQHVLLAAQLKGGGCTAQQNFLVPLIQMHAQQNRNNMSLK